MRSTVEALDDNKVKVSVVIDEAEFEPELDAAFRRIAKEVRLPGFRPGKAPRKVLEARLGRGFARSEAMREALPEYYHRAVVEHEVDVIASPEIDVTDGEETGPITFDAVVEVRPRVNVGGYDGLRVEIINPVPTDEEVDEQVDRLRDQFASLETVSRPATDTDHVTIDLSGTYNGEPLDGLTTTDYVYEVGSERVVPELDDELRGSRVGDIRQFNTDHPDPDEDGLIRLKVLVKEVQAKRLPELDDDFVQEASEFDTVEELRADLRTRIGDAKRQQANQMLRDRLAQALAELVDEDVPEALVAGEMENRLRDLLMRLQSQGVGMEQYLAATGTTQEQLVSQLREPAESGAKVDLALRAVAEAEELEADDDEIDTELEHLAELTQSDVADLRAELEHGDRMLAVRSELRKRKALEWLVERAEIVDTDGNSVDRSLLEAPDPETAADGADEADPGPAEPIDADEPDADADDAEADDEERLPDASE